ncbi:MAG: hypothetical protein JKY03_14025 [Aureispira sp.]|nr:hypothetical protein [Aureispira sp.]
MKILFYFILFTSILSCQNTTNKIDTTTQSTVDSLPKSNQEKKTKTPTPSISPRETFSKIPLLATYINELPFYGHQFPLEKAKERLILRADTIHFLEQEDVDYSYYYQLNNLNQQQAQFAGGWYGTSRQQDWKATYQLLNDNEAAPIVLLAVQSKEATGGYQASLEFNYSELEEMIEAGNTSIDKDDLDELANDMTNIGRWINSLNGAYNNHDLRFWVWQKQKGQWENITSKAFQPKMYKKLTTSFPFLRQVKVKNAPILGFFLAENIYSKEGLAQNKAHWKHWLGVEKLTDVSFDLSTNTQSIQLGISKNKTIRWDWNGDDFILNNLPKPISWKDEPCSNIDYFSTKKHTFVGSIAGIPIKMKVNLNDGKILGNYWYLNNPNSIFPIAGDFEASTEATLHFYRLKNKAKREHFHAYFVDCQFKGWWQHQGTMKIEKFSLKLVQE